MKLQISKDDMGWNWLISEAELVVAFGGQKSFLTELDAQGAYDALAHDMRTSGCALGYGLRAAIGMYAIDTLKTSAIRFATLHTSEKAGVAQVGKVLSFIVEGK